MLLVVTLTSCASAPTRPARPMFKGVELYSWRDAPGNAWRFVLLPGTNRRKTAAEVLGAPQVLRSWDELKARLSLLAPSEEVFWLLLDGDRSGMPPRADVDAIVRHAAAMGIRIHGPGP